MRSPLGSCNAFFLEWDQILPSAPLPPPFWDTLTCIHVWYDLSRVGFLVWVHTFSCELPCENCYHSEKKDSDPLQDNALHNWYTYMNAFTHVQNNNLYVSMYIHTCIYANLYIYIYIYVNMYVYIHTYIYIIKQIYIYVCTHINMYTYIHMYTYICLYIYMCMPLL